jgi:hypothetical protein
MRGSALDEGGRRRDDANAQRHGRGEYVHTFDEETIVLSVTQRCYSIWLTGFRQLQKIARLSIAHR